MTPKGSVWTRFSTGWKASLTTLPRQRSNNASAVIALRAGTRPETLFLTFE